MPHPSTHLDSIISKQNQTTHVRVVVVDIEKYSQRGSLAQLEVIRTFSNCLHAALDRVATKYLDYAQTNQLHFGKDILCLPRGDSAAIVFPFEGLAALPLRFATTLLQIVHGHNAKTPDINGVSYCLILPTCRRFKRRSECVFLVLWLFFSLRYQGMHNRRGFFLQTFT